VSFTTLVSTADLSAHLHDPGWIVFDCRHNLSDPEAGRRAYLEGHIPGAHFLHLDRDLSGPVTGANGRHPLPDPERFAARLAALGLEPEIQAVAYDDAGGIFASRLWWMLRWLGQERAAVLDGGLQKWIREEHTVTHALPVTRPGSFRARLKGTPVRTADLLPRLGSPELLILDARSPERFRGIGETLDPVGGHIPGAVNRFFRDNLERSGTFKAPEALRGEYLSLLAGRRPGAVVHQCGSGVTACHNLLAMEIAGLTGSHLYPGSWSEWCADPARPIATD
jgi:thiosulfate/3-mercaptopyruvate sulfurtransferase